MPYALALLGGFTAGVLTSALLEKRAVEEVHRLREYIVVELQKLALKL